MHFDTCEPGFAASTGFAGYPPHQSICLGGILCFPNLQLQEARSGTDSDFFVSKSSLQGPDCSCVNFTIQDSARSSHRPGHVYPSPCFCPLLCKRPLCMEPEIRIDQHF